MYKFQPKKPIRSFRDLEVYQKTLECSVLYSTDIKPKLEKEGYDLREGMTNCALSIPLYIAEAHSLRFSDFKSAIATLEKAMMGCNKMIVYYEQVKGIYSKGLPAELIDDLSMRYMTTRGKMFRLEKSWQKYRQADDNLARLKR